MILPIFYPPPRNFSDVDTQNGLVNLKPEKQKNLLETKGPSFGEISIP